MNYTEIVDKINSLRKLIATEMQEGDYIVSLLDKDGNILIKGRYGQAVKNMEISYLSRKILKKLMI